MCALGQIRLSGLTPGRGTQGDAFGNGWNTLALSHLSHVVGRVSHAGVRARQGQRGRLRGDLLFFPSLQTRGFRVQVPFCGRGEHGGLRSHPGLLVWGSHATLLRVCSALLSGSAFQNKGAERENAHYCDSLAQPPSSAWGDSAGAHGLRKSVKQAFAVQSPGHVPLFSDPGDRSPPGSSVHGMLLTRRPAWAAMSPCRGSSRPRDRTHVSCPGRRSLYPGATWKPQAKTLSWDC